MDSILQQIQDTTWDGFNIKIIFVVSPCCHFTRLRSERWITEGEKLDLSYSSAGLSGDSDPPTPRPWGERPTASLHSQTSRFALDLVRHHVTSTRASLRPASPLSALIRSTSPQAGDLIPPILPGRGLCFQKPDQL